MNNIIFYRERDGKRGCFYNPTEFNKENNQYFYSINSVVTDEELKEIQNCTRDKVQTLLTNYI